MPVRRVASDATLWDPKEDPKEDLTKIDFEELPYSPYAPREGNKRCVSVGLRNRTG
jgi:hypothetical protein